MKLVKLKCPNCGADLNMNKNDEIIKCKFCGLNSIIDNEKIVLEHKIKDDNYETTLDKALTYLNKLSKYQKAKELFLILSEMNPGDPQVWKGLIKSETKNFTELSIGFNGKTIADLELVETAFKDWQSLSEEDKDFKDEYEFYHKLICKIQKEYSRKVKKRNKTLVILSIILIILLSIICYVNDKKKTKAEPTTSELIEEYYEYTGTINCSYFKEGIVDITYDYFISKNKVYEITRTGLFTNNQQCRIIGSLGEKQSELGELRQLDSIYNGAIVLTENGYECDIRLTSCEKDYWSNLYLPSIDSKYGKENYTWAFKQNKTDGIPWMPGGLLFIHETNSLYYYDDKGSDNPIEETDLQKVELNFEEDEKIIHIGKNITTNKGFYYVKEDVLNSEECSKYVDVQCVWGLRAHKLKRLSRVYDDLYFAGRYIVAKDGSIYYGYSTK